MKIGFTGLNLREGKIRYEDDVLNALAKKDKPKKVSPYFVEFIRDEFVKCDAIVTAGDNFVDILILDMEKVEARQEAIAATKNGDNGAPGHSNELLKRCLVSLEAETPLCKMDFTPDEREEVKSIGVVSLKPVIAIDSDGDVNVVIRTALTAAGLTFFYTSGPTETHAWLIESGSNIITCAGKIHTALADGFIKGDVVGFDDYMTCHNFNDCRNKGLARLVDADYVVQDREIIEIRAKT